MGPTFAGKVPTIICYDWINWFCYWMLPGLLSTYRQTINIVSNISMKQFINWINYWYMSSIEFNSIIVSEPLYRLMFVSKVNYSWYLCYFVLTRKKTTQLIIFMIEMSASWSDLWSLNFTSGKIFILNQNMWNSGHTFRMAKKQRIG